MILTKFLYLLLGFPILIAHLERFINQISGVYDTKERVGGTLSSIVYFLKELKFLECKC